MTTRERASAGIGRFVLCLLAGAIAFPVVGYALYPFQAGWTIDFDADPPPRVVRGVYDVEHTDEGLTFAWTRGTFGLALPDLDRHTAWTLTMRLAASRADGTSPHVAVAIDGGMASDATLPAAGYVERQIVIPARSDAAPGGQVAVTIAPTFVPSADDRRELGAQLVWIRLEPAGRWVVSPQAMAGPIALGLLAGALIGVLALPWPLRIAMVAGTAVAAAAVFSRGLGPFVPLSWHPIAIATGIATLATALVLPWKTRGAAIVAGITMMAVLVKLLVLFHPDTPIGDALFQAHRLQDVMGGKLLFSSLTPGNYRFPYAIGLYLAAWPFSPGPGRAIANMEVLRMVVVIVEAVAAALLYRAVLRWRRDVAFAVATVAAYHLLPMGFSVIVTGNLTNAFAQSVAILALVALVSLAADPDQPDRPARTISVVLLASAACAAFLSHTSTFIVLTGQLALVAAGFLVSRRAPRRRLGVWIAAALVVALTIAVVVYYRHFMDVYREAFERVTAETGRASAAAGGRTPIERAWAFPRSLVLAFGVPTILLAAGGAWTIARRDRSSSTTAVWALWLAACVVFQVIGIVTPVDVRHFLAALPVVAAMAGAGVVEGWRAGGLWRPLAASLAVAMIWTAAVSWTP
jgi:hypothetical protein